MVHLLTVRYNFVKLVCFNKTLDDFVRRAGLLEYFKSKLRVVLSDCVTKSITHGKFAFVYPFLNQCNFTLLKNWSYQLKRLNLIQSNCLK